MALIEFLKNLQDNKDWLGSSNVGIFNVETGNASFRTSWVAECDCSLDAKQSLQYDCEKCGKTASNNVSIPAGDGDGIYTVISFLTKRGEVFATATLFDTGSKLAQEFIKSTEESELLELDALSSLFAVSYPGIEIGELELSEGRAIFISDSAAGTDSSMPTVWVNEWVPGGITAYAFVEDSVDNPTAQIAIELGTSPKNFNGGYEQSFRPRVVLLVSDAFKKMHSNLVDFQLSEDQWTQQITAWSKQQVLGHVSEQSNIAIYWNGRIENVFLSNALENNLENALDYGFKEFSWYLQGATFGDDDCTQYAKEMIEESGGELSDPELLGSAYRFRGLMSKANELQ